MTLGFLFFILLGACPASSWAQTASTAAVPGAVAASTEGAVGSIGQPLSLDKGPWVLGEILLFSGPKLSTESQWRDRIRAKRGALYTKSDIQSDRDSVKSIELYEKVAASLYEIPDSPVPQEFFSIASSTNQVRLVFNVVEKASDTAQVPVKQIPPAAVSGVVLTPTAYRGGGKHNSPGMGLDINAAYFIGRLYGKNSFANTVRKVNYIDRLGVWLLVANGKMQIQSESTYRPAIAAGAEGGVTFRDAPQPSINTTNSLSVPVRQKTAQYLSDAYVVASKKMYGVRSSVGFLQGNMGNFVSRISENLTPEALEFYAGQRGQSVRTNTVVFASLLAFPKADQPLGVEFMKFNGAALNPILINFKMGYFFKLNFDVSYLKYKGGYDVLGTIQFRYNHFPRR